MAPKCTNEQFTGIAGKKIYVINSKAVYLSLIYRSMAPIYMMFQSKAYECNIFIHLERVDRKNYHFNSNIWIKYNRKTKKKHAHAECETTVKHVKIRFKLR